MIKQTTYSTVRDKDRNAKPYLNFGPPHKFDVLRLEPMAFAHIYHMFIIFALPLRGLKNTKDIVIGPVLLAKVQRITQCEEESLNDSTTKHTVQNDAKRCKSVNGPRLEETKVGTNASSLKKKRELTDRHQKETGRTKLGE